MSLLDGYNPDTQEEKRTSLLDGYAPETPKKERKSLLDGYEQPKKISQPKASKPKATNKPIITTETPVQTETQENNLLQGYEAPKIAGGIKKDVRTYGGRFEDRPNRFAYDLQEFQNEPSIGKGAKLIPSALWNIPTGFFENARKDVVETGRGLAQMLGNAVWQGGAENIFRPILNWRDVAEAPKGEKMKTLGELVVTPEEREHGKQFLQSNINTVTSFPKLFQEDEAGNNAFRMQYRQDHPEVMGIKDALVQGLKETYGQKDRDISQEGIDVPGFLQSFYAHPLNLLDVVGAGEVGKIGGVGRKAAKMGKDFTKTVGNKTVTAPRSENLVIQGLQRAAETKPVQKIVNITDTTPGLRQLSETTADFLGLDPSSRLIGEKAAASRQAKLLDQKYQIKNITERNKAIAQNKEELGGLTDAEAKQLIENIETGQGEAYNYVQPGDVENLGKQISKDLVDETKQNIEALKDPSTKHEYVNRRYKNRYFKQLVEDDLTYDLKEAGKEFNAVLDDIKKNPNEAFNKYDEFENRLAEKADKLPQEAQEEIYNKFVSAINETANLEEKLKGANTTASNILKEQAQQRKNAIPELSEKAKDVKEKLRQKAQSNADYYIKNELLKEDTVKDLPVNTYAALKYNKNIDDLTDVEKVEALKDIQKLPDEQKPFYVPRMFDDKLKASDFFADSQRRYKPTGLKHRSVGRGDVNATGGKRVYDPVELANRMDAQRIKYENTEKMISEVIDNFAKPFNPTKEQILDGYVPFNPDGFLKFYRGSIDLNKTTLRKLQELDNVDEAFKAALQESIAKLPDDIKEYMGVMKNNNIYQIPKEVAEALTYGKNKKGVPEMAFDMFTAGFKRKVLGTSIKWVENNIIGNFLMGLGKSVDPQFYIRALKTADNMFPEELKGKSLYEAEKTIIGRAGGGDDGAFGKSMRLLGGEFIDTSELKGIQKTQAQAANVLALPGKAINAATDAMFNFNQKFESLFRKAAYLKHVDKTGKQMIKTAGQNITKQDEILKYVLDNEDVKNAVMKNVDDTLGDYINMTANERRVLRKFVPFYSWFRTITRYTLSLAETNPIRADLMNKISIIEAEEDKKRPEYQQGAIDTGLRSQKGRKRILLNYEHSIPSSTFYETADNPIGVINPLLTKPIETLGGRRFFMGQELTSPHYKNLYNGGYASVEPETFGETTNQLPLGERAMGLGLDMLRTNIPYWEFLERVGIGGVHNLIRKGEFTPYDKLWDTGFGGYNYEDVGRRNKGWTPTEQFVKYFLPIQQEGQAKKINKRKLRKYMND